MMLLLNFGGLRLERKYLHDVGRCSRSNISRHDLHTLGLLFDVNVATRPYDGFHNDSNRKHPQDSLEVIFDGFSNNKIH